MGRNQPCPCGSGRRYKECHGALRVADDRAPAADAGDESRAWIPAMLETALRAQRNGRGAEAAQCYRRVLAADSSNFDATHMLALIEYEYGRYDAAIELLRRAIELRPDLGSAKHNLRLLESMPQIEDGVCREIVPRLLPRIEPVNDVARFAPSAAPIHIVLMDATADERSMLEQLRIAFGERTTEVWTHGAAPMPAGWKTIALAAGEHPKGGLLVLLGRSAAQAAWLGDSRPDRIMLAIVRDEPCVLVDRIDEASLFGDPKPGVVCASSALAQRLGLPRSAAISISEAEPTHGR